MKKRSGRYISANSKGSITVTTAGQRVLGSFACLNPRPAPVEMDLVRDAWWTYFLSNPKFMEHPPIERALNKALLEWAMGSEMFQRSKFSTIGRILLSSRSAEYLAEYVLKNPDVKKAMDQTKKAEFMLQQAQKMKPGPGRDQREAMAKGMVQKALEDFGQFSESMEAKALRAQATQAAEQAAEKLQQAMDSWGIGEGPGMEIPLEEIENVVDSLADPALLAFAEMVGKARGIALNINKPDEKQHVLITDAGYTMQPLDIFPTELMFLTDDQVSPEMHDVTLAGFAAHGSIGMVKQAEPKDTGILVFIVDGSGSMTGDREKLAKALALGLGRAAEENEQEWFGMVFGGDRSELTVPVGTGSPLPEVITFARFMFGGGTDFDSGVAAGYEFISRLEDPRKADLVMISDGDAHISSSTAALIRKSKEKWGTRFLALLVDHGYVDRVKPFTDYAAVVRSGEDLTKAAEGLSEALWK